LEEGEDLDTVLTEVKGMCESIQIPVESVDWDSMSSMSKDRFALIFRPLLMYWLHPMSEWLEGSIERDDRMRNWKCILVDYFKAAGCWLGVEGRQRSRRRRLMRIRRRHRIGLR
jgi:hypothetical protein